MKSIEFFIDAEIGAEMLPYERYKLYEWIKMAEPQGILEVGTGTCSASFYMLESLQDNDIECNLYTCDKTEHINVSNVKSKYENFKFSKASSSILIDHLIKNKYYFDFIFFDGPENPTLALENIKTLENNIPHGTYFCMHDWEFERRVYDKAISVKSSLIRPYIEESEDWKEIEVLSGLQVNSASGEYITQEADSVGLCLYQFQN
tara:strand:- start:951 stop:1565 length:615 start_codon:yes stop_codon:yes gene_type:complete